MITGLKVGFEQRFEECLTLGGRIVAVLQLGENHFLEGGRFGERLFSATMIARGKPAPDLFLYAAVRRPATAKALSGYLQQPLLLIAAITAPRLLRGPAEGELAGRRPRPYFRSGSTHFGGVPARGWRTPATIGD